MIPGLIAVAVLVVIFWFSQSGSAAETSCGGCVRYGFNELLQLAQGAGFDTDSATAAGIALAESSGNPNAVGDLQLGIRSVGLWQINLSAHPEYSEADMLDPAKNAAAAFQIYSDAGGFSPWTTFRTGAYQKFLQ